MSPETDLAPKRLPLPGRLLPRTLRDRVFEPAYCDLLATLPAGPARRPRLVSLRVLGLALDTLRVGSPHLVWTAVRTSRRVQLVFGAVVVVVALLIRLISSYGDTVTRY